MVRLIVEEDGGRRAFRLGQGVLTVGSGPEARLKLGASDVAELHFEIALAGDAATLRPRPGVLPPVVGGVPAAGEVTLELGTVVEIGSARLWLESEDAPPAPAAPASVRSAAPVRGAAVPDADRAHRRRQAIEGARSAPRRSVVERSRPRTKQGPPTALVVGLVLAGVAIVVVVGARIFTQGEKTIFNAAAVVDQARQFLENGQPDIARSKLDMLEQKGVSLSDELEKAVEEVRDGIRAAEKEVALYAENEVGTRFLDNQLDKYEKNYLQGNPEKAKIRLFLLRCEEFRRRWPRHHKMDWVDRHARRFEGIVSLGDPPTLEDVLWEVQDCVDTMPRYYAKALALLDDFAATASPEDRAAAEARRAELVTERKEYALDRLQQAKYELQKKSDPGKCVWWLVNSVCHLGDTEMENDAARRLLQMPNIDQHLLGYRDQRPEYWKLLMENDLVRAEAKRLGIQ